MKDNKLKVFNQRQQNSYSEQREQRRERSTAFKRSNGRRGRVTPLGNLAPSPSLLRVVHEVVVK
jgi:hypothetical protein